MVTSPVATRNVVMVSQIPIEVSAANRGERTAARTAPSLRSNDDWPRTQPTRWNRRPTADPESGSVVVR